MGVVGAVEMGVVGTVGTVEIGTVEMGAVEMGVVDIGILEIGILEIGTIGIVETGGLEAGTLEAADNITIIIIVNTIKTEAISKYFTLFEIGILINFLYLTQKIKYI
jgi:hypothetical protein